MFAHPWPIDTSSVCDMNSAAAAAVCGLCSYTCVTCLCVLVPSSKVLRRLLRASLRSFWLPTSPSG